MPRFHFNFWEADGLSPDPIGVEFDSIERAYLAAFETGRDMWTELLRQHKNPLQCAFEITDVNQRVLITVPFSEVLEMVQHRSSKTMPEPHKVHSEVAECHQRAMRLIDEIRTATELAQKRINEMRGLMENLPAPLPANEASRHLADVLRSSLDQVRPDNHLSAVVTQHPSWPPMP